MRLRQGRDTASTGTRESPPDISLSGDGAEQSSRPAHLRQRPRDLTERTLRRPPSTITPPASLLPSPASPAHGPAIPKQAFLQSLLFRGS